MSGTAIQRVGVLGALGTSAVVAAYDGWLCSRGLTLGGGVYYLHKFIVLGMLATWVVADTRTARHNFPSLDHGWFVMCVPFYLTYYLVSTRRWWWGLLILIGMMVLWELPNITEAFVCNGS
jgi:hypothetical protein